jgi:Na+/H+ antiporter NhaC
MAKNKNKDLKQQQAPAQKTSDEFSFKDYFYINIFFWAFLLVVAIIVFFSTGAKMDPIMENVFTFIFLVFGCGFTAVSIFDGIYEKFNKGAKDEK